MFVDLTHVIILLVADAIGDGVINVKEGIIFFISHFISKKIVKQRYCN